MLADAGNASKRRRFACPQVVISCVVRPMRESMRRKPPLPKPNGCGSRIFMLPREGSNECYRPRPALCRYLGHEPAVGTDRRDSHPGRGSDSVERGHLTEWRSMASCRRSAKFSKASRSDIREGQAFCSSENGLPAQGRTSGGKVKGVADEI